MTKTKYQLFVQSSLRLQTLILTNKVIQIKKWLIGFKYLFK